MGQSYFNEDDVIKQSSFPLAMSNIGQSDNMKTLSSLNGGGNYFKKLIQTIFKKNTVLCLSG